MEFQNFATICNFWLYKPLVAQYMFRAQNQFCSELREIIFCKKSNDYIQLCVPSLLTLQFIPCGTDLKCYCKKFGNSSQQIQMVNGVVPSHCIWPSATEFKKWSIRKELTQSEVHNQHQSFQLFLGWKVKCHSKTALQMLANP